MAELGRTVAGLLAYTGFIICIICIPILLLPQQVGFCLLLLASMLIPWTNSPMPCG